MEKRLIKQNLLIEALLDGNKEILRNAEHILSLSVIGKEQQNSSQTYLHPEVKNFLTEEDSVLTPPGVKTDGTLTRYFGPDPKDLNPLTVSVPDVSDAIQNYCGEPFARRHMDNPELWKPALAERVEITDDYKEYTIYIRRGVKWHKASVNPEKGHHNWLMGEHYVTAKDVKFTMELILDQRVECPSLRNKFQELDYCKVVDDYTVVFRWKKKIFTSLNSTLGFTPVPAFIYGFDEDAKPFPKETLGFNFNNHWYNNKFIGCGPYEFASYEPGIAIRLKRNEDYYGEKPAIKEIIWLIYQDPLQHIRKLKNREIDFVVLTPEQYREEILKKKRDSPFQNGRIHYSKFLYYSYSYIGWNEKNQLFADKRVRQALSHAFNGRDILKNIFLGLGELTSGPFHIDSPYYNKDLPYPEFNLDTSRRLLLEAGWKDIDGDGILEKDINGKIKKFEFTLLLFGRNAEWNSAAGVFREDLMKTGIRMNIQNLDRSVMQKKIDDRDFDAFTGNRTITWEPDLYDSWHSSPSAAESLNVTGFSNKKADGILEELMSTFDEKKQIELCHKFHEILYEEQPFTFFRSPVVIYAWQDRVKGVIFKKVRPHADSIPWYIEE